jgi:hypothetical protein
VVLWYDKNPAEIYVEKVYLNEMKTNVAATNIVWSLVTAVWTTGKGRVFMGFI